MKHHLRLSALFLCLFLLLSALPSCNFNIPQITLPGSTPSPSYDTESNLAEAESHARPTPTVPSIYHEGFYHQLTPNEKAIYDAVRENAPGAEIDLTFPEPHFLSCPVGGEPSEEEMRAVGSAMNAEIRNALIALWLDDPAYYWGAIGLEGEQFTYNKERTEHGNFLITKIRFAAGKEAHFANVTEADVEALYAAARAIPITGNTVEEKVRAINKAICDMAEYSTEGVYAHEARGVVRDGKAVCEGFARAFQLLCEVNGVESVCVFGNGVTSEGTEGHMWNYVKNDDGKWYAVDVTWNENTDSEKYLLCGLKTKIYGERFEETHIPSGKVGDEAREFVYPNPEQVGVGEGI